MIDYSQRKTLTGGGCGQGRATALGSLVTLLLRRQLSRQVFHLRADEPHAERYGADGVEYLVGRK